MMTFDVTHVEDGEKFEVFADSRDVLVWERTSKTQEKYIHLLSELNMVGMYRLCWIAARRLDLIDAAVKLPEFELEHTLHFGRDDVVPTSGEVSADE